jgi:hypothetical protein
MDKQKKAFLALALAFALTIGLSGCSSFNEPDAEQVEYDQEKSGAAADPSAGDTPIEEASSKSGHTVVTSPLAQAPVTSPLTVSGRARAFENTVNIRIKDANGEILAETFATADGDLGRFGEFSTAINFDATTANKGTLEVFQISAEDGSERDQVVIPITFAR